uniref:Ammonium transporter AmtB-like domain-containing protein n=1 Tax=Daphnia galeata TaxID=27404 RepID=A0A8J2WRM6_9CRUS|nr:unnamed protein product [Daphnia galeata]
MDTSPMELSWATVYTEYLYRWTDRNPGKIRYPTAITDAHVMMFVGFGYLLILMKSLLNADFACAGVLISCAAVTELTTPLQLFFMSLLEIILYSTNNWIGTVVFQASDVGSSMFVHVFGAYFGLAVSFVLYRRTAYSTDKQSRKDEANGSINESVSATVGTMFLWLLWPSFNACLAKGDAEQFRAIINTYYSLSASCVTAFAVVFQNSTLVGGVVIGTSADMMINIWGAMILGGLAGAVSIFIDRLSTTKAIHRIIGIRNAWGVNTLHGIPGIVAGLVGAIVSAAATKEDYGFSLYRQFPARSPLNSSSEFSKIQYYNLKIDPGRERTALQQAGFQIAALIVTLVIAIIGGLGTGMILVLPFFRPSYEENDSQSDQLTLVDQLLLSERHLDVIDITNENNPVVILTENSAST